MDKSLLFANAPLGRLKQLRLGLSKQPRANALESLFGWLVFLAVLAWFYRLPPWMWSTHLHYGGDTIEAVWQANFWRDAVLSGDFNLISREMAYPVGTHQFIEAHSGPGLLLLPVSLAFGGTAAVNVGFVGGFILCFIGARRFLRSPHLGRSATRQQRQGYFRSPSLGTASVFVVLALSSQSPSKR